MRDVRVPVPNPAITRLLVSVEMRALMREKAEIAQALYQAEVAKRTGRLARSARVETFKGGSRQDRWCGRLIVEAPYTASHEFGYDDGDTRIVAGHHDLNVVLNQLSAL